ncbi:hypothetical protein [Lactobacillus sp. PV012]|uniref:hypothetical protein n=1 Tax=Lactobacillus sp. PV012 TaxID=2594494 RepID=UPI00223FDFD4|nr:hypothetical protein [Lactobacillus sp. PV012]QNQ82191.1 hypothetical protein FP433_03640 [Lactobacillus sp. PV012]
MKVTKLVIGILQILFAVVILIQSCAVGASHAMENNTKDVGGSVGVFVAILFLATGIVYIATRKAQGLGGDIAGLVMMIIAWLFGISNAHDYTDLAIWGWLALIIGVGFFVWHIIANKKAND